MSAMLLSIKPEYAQRIIDGTKQFEFRTRRCREDITKIIFYSTVPESTVVGEAEIEEVLVGAPSTIWEKTKHAAGIPRSFFRQYYKGRPQAVAYKLKNVIAYDTPKALSDYGITHVPQSFIYIEDEPC